MESTLFPSKTSFAFLAWLLVVVFVTTSPSIIKIASHLIRSTYDQYNAPAPAPDPLLNENTVTVTYSDKKAEPALDFTKQDVYCMAENIYYEASTQSYVGKLAIGLVVLNRLKSPKYPDTICGVIFEGSQNIHTSTCQFSWSCNPRSAINTNSIAWHQSLKIATELLAKNESIIDITEGATFYHAAYVNPPWAKTLNHVVQIDQHIFYSAKTTNL